MTTDWQYERKMSSHAFKRAIKQLYVTQAFVGRYIGVSPRTLRRMIKGQAKVPTSAALLLRSLIAHNERPRMPKLKQG